MTAQAVFEPDERLEMSTSLTLRVSDLVQFHPKLIPRLRDALILGPSDDSPTPAERLVLAPRFSDVLLVYCVLPLVVLGVGDALAGNFTLTTVPSDETNSLLMLNDLQ